MITNTTSLIIIYEDEYLIAINKPCGLLVHRTSIASQENIFAVQLLRDQIGQYVYPIHRLDRKTSGVLLFAKNKKIIKSVQKEFTNHKVIKKYKTIVRGFFPDEIKVDYALTNDRGKTQDAITFFKCLKKSELNIPFGKYNTSRYSLIDAFPKSGRMHQIRKHCNHLRHPIIGDRPHGCNKQNKLFKEKWDMITCLLHAEELIFQHPILKKKIILRAELNSEFIRMKEVLKL